MVSLTVTPLPTSPIVKAGSFFTDLKVAQFEKKTFLCLLCHVCFVMLCCLVNIVSFYLIESPEKLSRIVLNGCIHFFKNKPSRKPQKVT